jgi:hypothetical protein
MLHNHISRDRMSRCGAKQVDTRCFLLLLGLGLLFGELDWCSRSDSCLSIWIRKAGLSVRIRQAIRVGQALRFLGVWGRHGLSKGRRCREVWQLLLQLLVLPLQLLVRFAENRDNEIVFQE